MKYLKTMFIGGALLVPPASGSAALFDRGNGLIYDSAKNVTWVADMNYAKTSGFDSDGRMTRTNAAAWVSTLVYEGFSDWRLPTLDFNDPTCSFAGTPNNSVGTGCSGGELSHLFVVELGNKPFEPVSFQAGDSATQIANFSLFKNVTSAVYWSGTTSNGYQGIFSTTIGFQDLNPGGADEFLTLLVRDGDVAAVTPTPIPEPTTMHLVIGVAVAGLLGAKNRERESQTI